MGLFSDKKPYTAISSETEALLNQGTSYDPAKLLNLIELIQGSRPADAGGREAGRVLRKRIKHGSASDQIKAVLLIETIVDNGVRTGPFVMDSGLSDQLVQLAASHTNRADVTREGKASRQCRSLLHSWSTRKDRNIAQLFSKAGLVDKHERSRNRRSVHVDDDLDTAVFRPDSTPRSRSASTSSWANNSGGSGGSTTPIAPVTPPRPSARSHRPSQALSRSPSPVNIRGASIETIVATSHNVAVKLTAALIESPSGSRETETYYRQGKQLRHRVIQLVHDSDQEVQAYVGQLLSANEELVTALQAHDAVVKSGEPLEERDDHEELDQETLNRIKKARSIDPVRPPPSPPRVSDSESDFDDLEPSRSARHQNPFDPFADDNEQMERPKHTPLW